MISVLIYNEYRHEKTDEYVKAIYPQGIHNTLKDLLADDNFKIETVTLDSISEITPDRLKTVDVMIWWGHMAHNEVPDEVAMCVRDAVHNGMGIIFLHSGHHSKPFKLLMGTSCNLTWREDGDRELVWVCKPSHPIAKGLGRYILLEHEETYGEPFAVPEPDELVFIGNFSGGEVFRAGCCYKRENGKIFYFQPGHETVPTFKNPDVIKVIKNAINWAYSEYRITMECPHVEKPVL